MRETEGGSDETGSNKVTVSSWSRSCRTWIRQRWDISWNTGIVWAQNKSCFMMWNDIMDGREATQRGKWKGDIKLAV